MEQRVAVPVVQGGQPQPFLRGDAPVQLDQEAVNEMQGRIIHALQSGAISPPQADLIARTELLKLQENAEKEKIRAEVARRAALAQQRIQYG